MKIHTLKTNIGRWLGLVILSQLPGLPLTASDGGYQARALVSNLPGIADHTDPNALNSWGLVVAPDGRLVVAQNHANLASFYHADGRPLPFSINANEAPTGMLLNRSLREFVIGTGRHRGPSILIFSTEAGTILGWNPAVDRTNTVVAADNSANGAVYKGLAIGRVGLHHFLYAADFHNAKVDVYDGAFHLVGSFTDPTVDPGFAPFNVENIGGKLFVTFALQKGPDNADDQSGPGNGFIDIFDLGGHMLSRFTSHGTLNSPWGLALAPRSFGQFGGALLVGNFGDGIINAFNPQTGAFLGQLADAGGTPIQIDGLWSLRFRHNQRWQRDADEDEEDINANSATLYFTAGPGGEADGLIGLIQAN